MRGLVFLIFVSSLLLSIAFVQKATIPIVRASIQQGDLEIGGNTVYTIEGRFDINGSIIVKENATLILKNAFLNFTQAEAGQFNITLRNPSNGNPRLSAFNSTITSNFQTVTYLFGNSTAVINNSTFYSINPIGWRQVIEAHDHSSLSVSGSSGLGDLIICDFSSVSIRNSTIKCFDCCGSSEVQIHDSETDFSLSIYSRSVNCTIAYLEPGLISYWSFVTNCSVNILAGGSTPNVTLTNTKINGWDFGFYGGSSVKMMRSTLRIVKAMDSSVIHLNLTSCTIVMASDSSMLFISDSFINQELWAYGSSNVWLLNSTYGYDWRVHDSAMVYVSQYLDVHVVDSIGQNVPSANVVATYPNSSVAESKLTDESGWTRLTLMDKMMNATGTYPVGNYTVEASYETHSNSTTVNMTESKQLALVLGFIVPEFPSFLILPLFMIVTLLAVIVYKRKQTTLVSKID